MTFPDDPQLLVVAHVLVLLGGGAPALLQQALEALDVKVELADEELLVPAAHRLEHGRVVVVEAVLRRVVVGRRGEEVLHQVRLDCADVGAEEVLRHPDGYL